MIAFFDKEYGKKMIGCQGRIVLISIPNSYAPSIIIARKMGSARYQNSPIGRYSLPREENFSSHLSLNGNS
jgi:hypothetical protein